MAVQTNRPDVADMTLRTFERPLHPELFDAAKSCSVRAGQSRVVFHLSSGGHVIEFQAVDCCVTETALTRHVSLPEKLRVVDRRLIGYRTHMVDLPGIRYHCSYQLESVPPDVYLQLHREFETDARTATLALQLPGATENSPECLSLLKCDVIPEGLVVHAYHTFPDDAAVLRIQTLFETLG